MDIDFDTVFDPRHGEAVPLGDGILRVTAPNASAYTFHGTNSYVIGDGSVVVVDPGPDEDRHLDALTSAIGGRKVDAILLTHTHRDHTALVPRLVAVTGAPIVAEGPHRTSRALHIGEHNAMDSAGDGTIVPDLIVADGEILDLPAGRFGAIATPGHTANHMAFSIGETGLLLSGDHVMAWATTVVAPPDGSMADYMASLDKLLGREDEAYLPGHGGIVRRPQQMLRGLRSHRRMRETAILERLRAGDRTVDDIVKVIYRQTDPRLHKAAAFSVLAHLEDLVASGRAVSEGDVMLDGRYRERS